MRTRCTRSEAIQRDAALYQEEIRQEEEHRRRIEEIRAAVTYGQFHDRIYGVRRWLRHGEEPEHKSYAREARLVIGPNWEPWMLWGREWWVRNRAENPRLIAWTEDSSGRIVRGWTRHLTASERRAYEQPGDLSCPREATWLPSAGPGLLTFPAWQFQRHRDGDTTPALLATIRNLQELRPCALDAVAPERSS